MTRTLSAVLFVLATGLSMNVSVEAKEQPRTISVSGQGRVSAPPDMATIQTGVVTEAETAADALAANNAAMEKLMDVLSEHHVARKDIQTSQFSVSPVYRHDPKRQRPPEVVGYRVQNQVRVHVRNLPELGRVLDALVKAGSNQVSGVSFGVDDPTGILNQARSRAVADARSRAGVYAQAAGVEVGRVRTISEQTPGTPRPMEFRMAAAEGAGVPVATGELEFTASVHVVFELKDGDEVEAGR